MTTEAARAIEAAAKESWKRCIELKQPISGIGDFVEIINRHLGPYLPKEVMELRERAAFERGRESREPEIAALRFEIRHALKFLDHLQLSDNPCVQPEDPQAAVFHMVHGGLFDALIEKTEG